MIDVRILRAIGVLVLCSSWILGLSLPVPIDPWTRDFYNAVEAIPAGSYVGIAVETRYAMWGSIVDQFKVITRHFMAKNVKMVFWGFLFPDTATEIEELFLQVDMAKTKTYGVDYVNFGFIAGGMYALQAMCENVPSILGVDAYGKSAATLPMMSGLKTASDFKFIAMGWSGNVDYMSILGPKSKWHLPFGELLQSQDILYWQTGSVTAFLEGVMGSAQYEKISGFTGKSLVADSALGVELTYIIIIVALGNIEYFIAKRGKKIVAEAK